MPRYDLVAHFLVNFLIVILLGLSGLLGMGITLAIILSVGKEIWDLRDDGDASFMDLVADSLGIFFGVAIVLTIGGMI